jgi:hypothetical protein
MRRKHQSQCLGETVGEKERLACESLELYPKLYVFRAKMVKGKRAEVGEHVLELRCR